MGGKSNLLPKKKQMDKENKLILYKDDEGKVNVNVRFADLSADDGHLCHIYRLRPSREDDKAVLRHGAEQDALCCA